MANTYHHKMQKHQHVGHDYGGRYKCNWGYGNGYGKAGRNASHKEMRHDTRMIKSETMRNYEQASL